MDYLPNDPHEKEKIKQTMLENKLKDYRSYIVDKGIAKALVQGKINFSINFHQLVILKLRYQETKPKNPMKTIRDFFQNYRDPFNPSFQMQNDLENMKKENPKLEEKIIQLEAEIEVQKIKFRVKGVYGMFDLDPKTVNTLLINLIIRAP